MWSGCLCLPNSNPNFQNNIIQRSRDFGRKLSHEGGPLMDKIMPFKMRSTKVGGRAGGKKNEIHIHHYYIPSFEATKNAINKSKRVKAK